MQWIKTSERLPEKGQTVLIYNEIYGINAGSFVDWDMWKRYPIGFIKKPTHWMPLPPAPETTNP